jgi:hypothetical protein
MREWIVGVFQERERVSKGWIRGEILYNVRKIPKSGKRGKFIP